MAAKKQIPLRLSAELYEALSLWAEDDFRSLNGQIEYLLTEACRKQKRLRQPQAEKPEAGPEAGV